MGGGIIRWAIERPVSVAVGVILIALFGALSIAGIPIQLTPDVEVPTVTVSTVWPGATPTEVEAEILEKQEEALKSLPGLVRMESTAGRDQGSITLELEVGSSLDQGLVRVSNLLSQVPAYPATAREPVITTANSTGPPLAVMVIQSVPPGRDVAEYRTWVEDVVLPRIERVRGVANVRLIGGRDREVHIDFDPRALAARGVTVAQLVATVRGNLVDASAGDIPMGKRRYVVRTEVAPNPPEQLEQVVLTTSPTGTPVRLGDVATVAVGLRKSDAVAMVNGSPAMALLCFRETGSNVLAVTREICRVVDEMQESLLAPEGLEIRIVSDQVDYIEGALDLVRSNLILGGVLAVVVLMLFLRSVGASAVVALSIPVSVIGTVLLMSLMGRTINIVSLAGMAFAVGMVVDNSIVVLENIDTWRSRGHDVARSALEGTREVWGAILASTLTTAVVFIPIISWQDEIGELLRDVAIAISTAVFVSLVVSVVVIPSFSARLLRSRRAGGRDEAGEAGASDESAGPAAAVPEPVARYRRVGRAVHWIARSRLRALAVTAIGIGGAAALGLGLLPSMEYLPTGNRNIVFGVVIPPPGYSVEEMQNVAEHVQGRIVPHIDKEVGGVPAVSRTFFAGGPEQAFMGAVAVNPDEVGEMAGFLRGVLAEVPDVIGIASQGSLFGRRIGGGRAIELDISGPDLIALTQLGGRLMGALRNALPGAQIQPIPGLDPGAPEFRVIPRRAQAAQLGISPADIGLLVDAYVDGAIIGELGRAGEPKRDVVLRAVTAETATGIGDQADDRPDGRSDVRPIGRRDGQYIRDTQALAAAPIAAPGGRLVPLGEVAHIRETLGPTVIRRLERRRAITLQIAPPDDIALEDALDRVERDVVAPLRAQGAIPENVRLSYSGTAGQLEQTKARFGWVLLLAVVICFLLLSALFEDFLAPLAILVTVPLAGAGGVLGLRLVDATLGRQPLDMLTATGFVILIGVVVNNAILIVDGALTRMRKGGDGTLARTREHGVSLEDAVADAVRGRVRPILMSALTSLAGLLPLVLFPGFGSELYRGVGGIVLGGLAFSTVLSLFVVPAVFTSLWRLRRLVGGGLRAVTWARGSSRGSARS